MIMAQLFRIAVIPTPNAPVTNDDMWIVSETLFWDHIKEQLQLLEDYTAEKLNQCMANVEKILSKNQEHNALNEIVLKGTLFQVIGRKGS